MFKNITNVTGPLFRSYLKRTLVKAANSSEDKVGAALKAIEDIFACLEQRIKEPSKLHEHRLLREAEEK